MKKEIKVAIAVFVAIWIFIIGIEVGVLKERKANVQSTDSAIPTVTTESTSQTTTESTTTTQPTTEPSTQNMPSSDVVPSSDVNANVSVNETTASNPAPSNDPSSMTKEQVLENVVKYVAQLKGEQNMTATKKESIKVQLTELSISAAKSIVQNIIDKLAGDEEITYTFSGGQATNPDGNSVTPNDVIPPTGKAFSLTAAGVKEGKAEKSGDNTVYTLILVEESTTLEVPEPIHNAAAIGYLNLGGLDVSPAKLTKADMKYPGSKVVITVDANDKVISLKNELPMTGVGEAEVFKMTGSASFEGGLNEEWTFSY